MTHSKYAIVLTLAGVCGGLFLTLLSGLHTVKPLVMDAEIIYFGFPATWLEAGRSAWMPKPPQNWQYQFFWPGLIADFIFFGLLTTAVVHVCFRLSARQSP